MAYEIDSIETVIVDLPLRRLQQFSAVGAQSQSVVLVFVSTRDGVRGVGEAVTPSGPWWSGESVETIKAMIDEYLAPLVVGESAFDRIAIMDKLDGKVFGNAFAKAGIEMALWDIQGKALGQPVYNLLGGKARDALPVSWPLATGEAEAEIAEAEEKIAAGLHNIFKLKMGALDPQTDVERAARVARGLEGRARVRVDPNERWDETILRWAAPRLAEAGVELIEQPLPRWNLDAAARFTAWAPLAHMLDESVCSLQDMVEVARRGAAGVVSLKVMKSKGLAGAKLVGDTAQALGVPIYMGTFLETSYGTGASMQVCATLKDLPYGGELAGPLLLSEDIATTPARYHDFQLHLQEGVGLGVDVDPDKLRAFRRDKTYSLHAVTA